MKLAVSNVRYDRVKHEYWLGEVKLEGITGMIKRQLFPNEYEGISQKVLENAAAHGSFIHDECEIADKFGDATSAIDEVAAYIKLRDEHGFVHENSEYVVSDEEHFASPIDKVYRVSDTEFIIGDIKTTSKYNSEYVRWQLSIYAYFFEMMNPWAKVVGLFGIWLPKAQYGKPAFFEEQRIAVEMVKALLDAEVKGEQFENPLAVAPTEASVPQKFIDMTKQIVEIAKMKKYYAEKEKELIAEVSAEMRKHNVYGWKTDSFSFSRKHDYTKSTFDLEAFKADYPDLPYEKFYKTSNVKGGVSLSISEK